jgi:outer membrane lipoprotein carrier protein
MNKLKGFLIGLISLASTNIIAQDQDPMAKMILDEMSNKNKTHESISGSFVNIMENKASGINREKEGSFILQNDMYYLKLDNNQIFSNQEESIRYDASDNFFYYMDEDEEMFNPADIFTIYNKDFKYKLIGDQTVDNQKCKVIYLWPIQTEGKDYQRLEIYINANSKQVYQFVSVGNDQTKFIIKLKNLVYDKKYTLDTFTFDESKYPGSEEG